jgi:hypothetical protein
MSPRPWLPLDEAVLLVLASSKIEVELQEFGERGILFLTDATWKELCAFLCDAGSEGRLRLRGRRNSSDDPAGEMEEIPQAYFAKDRAFFTSGDISHLPLNSTAATVEEERATREGSRQEDDWLEAHVNRKDLCTLLGMNGILRGFSSVKLRKWYEERVRSWPAKTQPPSRQTDCNEARKAFGNGVPREAVFVLRRELAPKEWTRSGRRKKSVNE